MTRHGYTPEEKAVLNQATIQEIHAKKVAWKNVLNEMKRKRIIQERFKVAKQTYFKLTSAEHLEEELKLLEKIDKSGIRSQRTKESMMIEDERMQWNQMKQNFEKIFMNAPNLPHNQEHQQQYHQQQYQQQPRHKIPQPMMKKTIMMIVPQEQDQQQQQRIWSPSTVSTSLKDDDDDDDLNYQRHDVDENENENTVKVGVGGTRTRVHDEEENDTSIEDDDDEEETVRVVIPQVKPLAWTIDMNPHTSTDNNNNNNNNKNHLTDHEESSSSSSSSSSTTSSPISSHSNHHHHQQSHQQQQQQSKRSTSQAIDIAMQAANTLVGRGGGEGRPMTMLYNRTSTIEKVKKIIFFFFKHSIDHFLN